MKKLLSFTLVAALCISTCFAFGVNDAQSIVESNNRRSISYQVNEYECAKALAQVDTEELGESGYSLQEIQAIKNYKQTYIEHIQELAELDNDLLANAGYTQEQINILKNFNGSEAQLMAVAATVNLHATATNFHYDGTYTQGRLAYTWTWDGIPAFKMEDALAVSWNDFIVTDEMSVITYYAYEVSAPEETRSATFSIEGCGTEGAYHKFQVQTESSTMLYRYAKTGSGHFDVRSDVHGIKDFHYYVEYGHSQVVPSISVSISGGGFSGSINFSLGTVVKAVDRGEYQLP